MEFDISKADNGILLVDKPAGWTSFDVCAKIRGQIRRELQQAASAEKGKGATGAADSLRAPRAEGKPSVVPHITKRQLRVGHAGTLDPFATGLLIVLLGEATKRSDEFLKLDKVYQATIRLGQTSSTGDPEGELSDVSHQEPSLAEVTKATQQFVGKISQIPPNYSAIKINGQRAYKLARAGKTVDMPARQVEIFAIEVLEYNYPDLTIQAHVSSGTYIRTLAEDIGALLETGAFCSQLRRSQIGSYHLSDRQALSDS